MLPVPPNPAPLNRLERRTAILRGKRRTAFDRDQYYLEQAERARIARKTRVRLRRMEPVFLVTPRWSQARAFLDDVAVDLMIGDPAVRARTLSLKPLEGRTPHQAWSWLALAMEEFCVLPLDAPAWQAVSRLGFREVMRELFVRAEAGERRCLMVHGTEHIHVEALRDLIEVFSLHRTELRTEPRFNLLLAGSTFVMGPEGGVAPGFPDVQPLVLPDFAEFEALEALVEHLGAEAIEPLNRLARLVGGVPALLDRIGDGGSKASELVRDRGQLWAALGVLASEIRRSFDIVTANEALHARLDRLSKEGALPPDPTDEPLVRAGLARTVGHSERARRTVLRAPFLADLTG